MKAVRRNPDPSPHPRHGPANTSFWEPARRQKSQNPFPDFRNFQSGNLYKMLDVCSDRAQCAFAILHPSSQFLLLFGEALVFPCLTWYSSLSHCYSNYGCCLRCTTFRVLFVSRFPFKDCFWTTERAVRSWEVVFTNNFRVLYCLLSLPGLRLIPECPLKWTRGSCGFGGLVHTMVTGLSVNFVVLSCFTSTKTSVKSNVFCPVPEVREANAPWRPRNPFWSPGLHLPPVRHFSTTCRWI